MPPTVLNILGLVLIIINFFFGFGGLYAFSLNRKKAYTPETAGKVFYSRYYYSLIWSFLGVVKQPSVNSFYVDKQKYEQYKWLVYLAVASVAAVLVSIVLLIAGLIINYL